MNWINMSVNSMSNLILVLLAFTVGLIGCLEQENGDTKPHIVFILADDLGYNDIGYHNSRIKTPHLDQLAREGVRLENYYVQPVCTPTRSQLLTGRYQIHTGLQHEVIRPPDRRALPIRFTTLAQKMKESGYSTHIVGKWHLGFYKSMFLPFNRGFDTFFGYLNGAEDYYNHTREYNKIQYLDLRDQHGPVWTQSGHFSTQLFAERASDIIRNHDHNKPLFMYLPFQNVHAPLQVPQKYIDIYKKTIRNKDRRIFAGMVSALDEAVKNVTDSLKSSGLWNNTLLIFSSDNGGDPDFAGNNWPLRGLKHTLWEGGMRVAGFVHGKGIETPGTVNKELIHVSDWFPTLVEGVANGSVSDLPKLDGFNLWETISQGRKSKRTVLLHNIDPLFPKKGPRRYNNTFDTRVRAALRVGDLKLVTGDPEIHPGSSGWIPIPPSPVVHDANLNLSTNKNKEKNIWLFNITADPLEKHDMAESHTQTVKYMLDILQNINRTSVKAMPVHYDKRCDPARHGRVWGPWL